MPFIHTGDLDPIEKRKGWSGRLFHSQNMTFVHWRFENGADIHEHAHPQEEVWEILSGALEVTIDGVTQVARPGVVAIIPPNAAHSVRVVRAGVAIVIDHPIRPDFA